MGDTFLVDGIGDMIVGGEIGRGEGKVWKSKKEREKNKKNCPK